MRVVQFQGSLSCFLLLIYFLFFFFWGGGGVRTECTHKYIKKIDHMYALKN